MPFALDLFCGAGGMSEGLIQAGFHILFSSDINEDVEKTYVNRHEQLGYVQGENTYFHRGDIRELSGQLIRKKIKNLSIFDDKTSDIDIDAIFGGPPCQGFSRAGRRNADDPRNYLFKEYLRVIHEIKPKYVVMENVVGFNDTKFWQFTGVMGKIYKDGTAAPEILKSEFKTIGYKTLEPRILDASDYGVPQRRNRVIFIAYRQDMVAPIYPAPITNTHNKLTIADGIGDLIRNSELKRSVQKGELSKYQLASKRGRTPHISGKPIVHIGELYNDELSSHQEIIVERFSLFLEGEDGADLRKRISQDGIELTRCPKLVEHCSKLLGMEKDDIILKFRIGHVDIQMLDALLTKKNIRTRLKRDAPSATIMTIADDYISPFENRALSVRESARLQSFDDSFVFLGKRTTGGLRRRVEVPQYTQVGNAVPPLLAKAIAVEIKRALE